jgi:tetratricopeptide (TPR) repeat protein
MILLSRASAAIDRALPEARRLALEAIELGRKGADRAVLARALGTFGRACTHDGVPAEGTDALREAIELFSRVDAPQSEQTRCYLATNLRTQGRVDDALSVAREAYASCERRRGSEHANDTLRYLSLELGRCWIERGDLDEARVSLARVHRADLGDASYPNIGALASLARIEAASMRNRSASDGVRAPAGAAFARCLEVARRDRSVIGRVAAQALGWQILSQDSDPASSVPWHEVWLARVPEARTREQVRAVVERFLY